ncbi:MAG: DUF4399 domain-containing protein [Burkholderiaceae bacterium]|jgi:hypothetical protein
MKMRLISVSLMLLLCSSVFAQSVDFIEPKNNANVSSPFKVKFAVDGMQVAPAGEMKEGTGHHHLLINAADIPEGTVIPMDDQHRHFGKGQTETEITLPPGRYRLTMQFADGAHRSYGEKMRKSIEVTVK